MVWLHFYIVPYPSEVGTLLHKQGLVATGVATTVCRVMNMTVNNSYFVKMSEWMFVFLRI